MNWLKKTWDWLEGKKRHIGIGLLSALDIATLIKPDLIPPDKYVHFVSAINILLLGASADTFRRSDKWKAIIEKAVKNATKFIKK